MFQLTNMSHVEGTSRIPFEPRLQRDYTLWIFRTESADPLIMSWLEKVP